MKKAVAPCTFFAVFAFVFAVSARAQRDDKAALTQRIDAGRDHYATVAKEIWGFAEVGYQEQKSSALLQQELKAAGFAVRAGVAEIPTAFVATYGSGKPASSTRCPGCRRRRRPHSATRSRKTAPVMAAATTCSAPARSPQPSR